VNGLGKIHYEFQFGFYRCEKSQAEKEKGIKIFRFILMSAPRTNLKSQNWRHITSKIHS